MVRRHRKDIVVVERAVPKVVALPNGRRFATIYKRTTRATLPANVMLNRTYKQSDAP